MTVKLFISVVVVVVVVVSKSFLLIYYETEKDRPARLKMLLSRWHYLGEAVTERLQAL